MRIIVHAKPGARENQVEKIDDTAFVVSVKALPIKGKANEAIIALLSDYFGVSKTRIHLKTGRISARKIIEIR